MLTQMSHMVMAVADLNISRSFYAQVFELPIIAQGTNAVGQAVCLFQLGGMVLELQEDAAVQAVAQKVDTGRPEVDHFALYVDDLEASYEILQKRDIVINGAPHTTELGHRNMQRALVTCVDPNGFHIQLAQVVDPRPQLAARRLAKQHMAAASDSPAALFGGIDHISSYCTDFSASRAFYKELLGMEEFFYSATREAGVEVAAGFEQAAFAIGGTDIELATDESWQEICPGPICQLGFFTDDIDQVYKLWQSRGLSLDGPPAACLYMPWRAFTLCGPDGLSVQIVQVL